MQRLFLAVIPEMEYIWRDFYVGILSALISGALMSIQGVFNTNVTKQTSLWVSTGWVQFSAFLVCVAAWFLQAEKVSACCGR